MAPIRRGWPRTAAELMALCAQWKPELDVLRAAKKDFTLAHTVFRTGLGHRVNVGKIHRFGFAAGPLTVSFQELPADGIKQKPAQWRDRGVCGARRGHRVWERGGRVPTGEL